ncbi:hypothetical protein BTM25_15410 [Actinomadura rubteroloni]|uniref:Phosphotransferase n=1 Tax=Actinomadura rubteroloni TaxID=1926885 RepID=A0A2P4UPZ8_9ACTN|nr:hypothetical protein [Actinomadura rubteroloni]POM27131.1 hypothetical protein BTM25_15410 [Actinomadura rubteroloni]
MTQRPRGRAGYVADLGALLWPAPRTVAIGRDAAPPRPALRRYLLVPHAREPRLMLPAGRRAGAAAVLGFNKDRSRKASLLSHVLAAGLRSGLARPLLRDRITIGGAPGTGGAPDIEAHLGAVFGADVVVGLHIGPDRANRKPVAQVLSASGRTLGYAKIGINPLTRELVRAERTALELLNARSLPTVRVPTVRHAGEWNGLEILVLDPLPVWSRHVPYDEGRMVAAVQEVAAVAGLSEARLATSPYLADLRERAAKTASPGGEAIRAALDRLAARDGDLVLPFGAWHGDWTAWNMAALPGSLLVWDWERYGEGVPVGYDAVHYVMQDAITEGRATARQAAEDGVADAARLLAPLGLDARRATLVALLYLAELGTRYLTDRQDEAGAALGRLDTWLLPVLTAWSERPAG